LKSGGAGVGRVAYRGKLIPYRPNGKKEKKNQGRANSQNWWRSPTRKGRKAGLVKRIFK